MTKNHSFHQNLEEDEPHYIGHRKRLKERFLKHDPSSFMDYELLELLLFHSIPRKDVRPLAKKIMKKFANFNDVFNSNKEVLLSIPEFRDNTYLQIRIIRELMNRLFHNKIEQKNIISSWGALLNYLKFNMGTLKIEQFRVLFLNSKNVLIADEVMATGTINQTPVYPREIVKKALFHEAGAIILVHNHPSGDVTPSNCDIDLTSQIVNACKVINVAVHDHVIISSEDYYSFKSNMLL